MATASDSEMHIGKVYGQALMDLASATGDQELLWQELAEFCGYLDMNTDFDRYLSSPMVDAGARAAALERIFRGRASDLFVNAVQVINEKGRLGSMRSIVEAYRQMLEESKDRIFVQVRTAVPLTQELRTLLISKLGGVAGREVDLEEQVEPGVMGGLIVKIRDQKYDNSVARRIRTLSDRLAERAIVESRVSERFVQNGQSVN